MFTQVTEARAKVAQMQLPDILTNPRTFKQFEEDQAASSGALGRLIAISEKYPALKSDENFLASQSQLEGTENRIALAAAITSMPCKLTIRRCTRFLTGG